MDKMRDEFEAAMVAKLNADNPEANITIEEVQQARAGDEYTSNIASAAWWAWQTSNESLGNHQAELLKNSYRAGWDASGEGWNAEYPSDCHERAHWIADRNKAITDLIDKEAQS